MYHPKNKVEYYKNEGIRFAREGKYTDAITMLGKSIEIEPENGDLRYNLGLVYANKGDLKNSVSEYLLAINFTPNFSDSYFGIATNLYTLGPTWKAVIFYLAFLDLCNFGEKVRVTQMRLSELGNEAFLFNIYEWLSSSKNDYNFIVKNYGKYVLRMIQDNKPNISIGPDLAKQLDEFLTNDVIVQKIQGLSAHHFSNALDFIENGKFRVAISQFISGLTNWPDNHSAICYLGYSYAKVGEYRLASELIDLVEIDKVEISSQEEVENTIRVTNSIINRNFIG